MVIIDVKPEQIYEVRCSQCRVLLGYSLVDGSPGMCADCATAKLEIYFRQREIFTFPLSP